LKKIEKSLKGSAKGIILLFKSSAKRTVFSPFHRENILTIPVGRVGFRCWGDEEAHFRKVRVKLID